MKKLILFFILVLPVVKAGDFSSLLPDSVGGWKKSGVAEPYAGDELFRLIDGGADIFNEYGFNCVIVQRYANPNDDFIDVEIYEMRDSSSAYGIFSLFTFKTGKRVDFIREAFAGDEFLLARKGEYYFSLTGSNTHKETKEGLFRIAKAIDAGIIPAGKPALVAMFERMTSSTIIYLKGNLGLYNVSKANFGRNFKVEEGISLEKEGTTAFIFHYKNDEECKKNYLLLLKDLRHQHEYGYLRIKRHIILLFARNKTGRENTLGELKNILKEYK